MKKFLSGVGAASMLLLAHLSYAQTFNGKTKLEKQEFDSVMVNGSLDFKEVKITTLKVNGETEGKDSTFGSVNVNGEFEAKDCSADTLTINGATDIKGCTIKGAATLNGRLEARGTTIGSLSISSEKMLLDDCVIEGDILVRAKQGATGAVGWMTRASNWIGSWFGGGDKVAEDVKAELLQLRGTTEVRGSITFESGVGIIEKGSQATIGGKVTGASLK